MPSAWAPTVGREASKVFMAAWLVERLPSRARASFSSSLSLPPRRQWPGTRHVVEHDLGGVGGADAHLLELLALGEARGVRRHDEAGLAPGPELGVDRGHHHVDVGDARRW